MLRCRNHLEERHKNDILISCDTALKAFVLQKINAAAFHFVKPAV